MSKGSEVPFPTPISIQTGSCGFRDNVLVLSLDDTLPKRGCPISIQFGPREGTDQVLDPLQARRLANWLLAAADWVEEIAKP